MKMLFIILCVILFFVWLYFYIVYKLMTLSVLVLNSAGKMKTGNDLAEQFEKNLKETPMPSFIQFYWRLFLKWRKIND